MAAAHIYREDLIRVIAYCNRLCLSLSICIRHGLIAKINDKRRPRAYEALGQILTDYLHIRHVPTPIASPRHAMPRPAR
jgi:hypothetical protein